MFKNQLRHILMNLIWCEQRNISHWLNKRSSAITDTLRDTPYVINFDNAHEDDTFVAFVRAW